MVCGLAVAPQLTRPSSEPKNSVCGVTMGPAWMAVPEATTGPGIRVQRASPVVSVMVEEAAPGAGGALKVTVTASVPAAPARAAGMVAVVADCAKSVGSLPVIATTAEGGPAFALLVRVKERGADDLVTGMDPK